MSDLVEMLRSVSPDDYGECCEVMSKAAAEIERLRAALEEIASGKYSGIVLMSYPPQDPAVNRARAALAQEKKDG